MNYQNRLRNLLLSSLVALAIVLLLGCETIPPEPTTEYIIPSLDAFEPPRVPTDLIDEPQTDADLLHNSIQYEFLMYDWQDYADGLARYIDQIRKIIGSE